MNHNPLEMSLVKYPQLSGLMIFLNILPLLTRFYFSQNGDLFNLEKLQLCLLVFGLLYSSLVHSYYYYGLGFGYYPFDYYWPSFYYPYYYYGYYFPRFTISIGRIGR